jgi:hypothetical protein
MDCVGLHAKSVQELFKISRELNQIVSKDLSLNEKEWSG